MALLVLGVLLWSLAHFFKRLAPGPRARMGDGGKGLVALLVGAGILCMIFGYRMADGTFYWGRSPAMVGINNLLMILSVYLFAVSGMKTRAARLLRHPMLTGLILWAVAHLLVNGDTPSFVLFGGLFLWALLEMVLINRAESWTPPPPAAPRKEVMAVAGTVVLYGVIAGIHTWLGYPTFG